MKTSTSLSINPALGNTKITNETEARSTSADVNAIYRQMLDDVASWGRAGYPGVACGRYKDAAELIRAQGRQIEMAVDVLRCIAAMGRKAGSESAKNWLLTHGFPLEEGGYIPGKGFSDEPSRISILALATFGARVLDEARDTLCDLDGGWLQDTAIECELLEPVAVTEACGEDCRCAEFDDFPQTCFQRTDAAKALDHE